MKMQGLFWFVALHAFSLHVAVFWFPRELLLDVTGLALFLDICQSCEQF